MELRRATVADAEAVAKLHADSWRRNYRGSYSDAYLDGDIFKDRLEVWTSRLSTPTSESDTVVAVDGDAVVGFVHTNFDHDPKWGALLDNLHVAHELKGRGVGTSLMARSASAALAHTPGTGLYLWVLEANTAAQAFYGSRGGTRESLQQSEAPGGGPNFRFRYVWPDPDVLL